MLREVRPFEPRRPLLERIKAKSTNDVTTGLYQLLRQDVVQADNELVTSVQNAIDLCYAVRILTKALESVY